MKCPKCKSKKIGGLMEAFWVSLNPDGTPAGEWNDWSAETELGEHRLCYKCGHEFKETDAKEPTNEPEKPNCGTIRRNASTR